MGFLNWLLGTTESLNMRKHSKDLVAAAESGAYVLLTICDTVCPSFSDILMGDHPSAKTPEITARGSAEVLVFALHLTDRIALTRLGNEKRAAFMDALLPAVRQSVHPPLATGLPDLYNQRTLFYQSCKMPSGKDNENLKGTLFWEFGKLMASPCQYPDPVYANWNPMCMTSLSLWAMQLMVAITDELDAAGVL